MPSKVGLWMRVYSAFLGGLYVSFGVMELMNAVYTMLLNPGAESPPITLVGVPRGDLFGALVSILIGVLLEMPTVLVVTRTDGRNSLPYMLGGTLLSAVFGGLYTLILASHTLSALIAGGEELREWLAGGWLTYALRPEIWLFVSAVPLTVKVWLRARRAGG